MVTVGDDGGSSGRLRAERGGLPPGDLRQALAALADPDDPVGRSWPRSCCSTGSRRRRSARRPRGRQPAACGLMELPATRSRRWTRPASWSGPTAGCCRCRRTPVGIEATVRGDDPDRPDRGHGPRSARGRGDPRHGDGGAADPADPAACAEAVDAVLEADWLVFGPGSWFTSVIPHLLVPDLAAAIAREPGPHGWLRSTSRPRRRRPGCPCRTICGPWPVTCPACESM